MKHHHTVILFFLFTLAPFLATLFAPALPELSNYFLVSPDTVQLTISTYLLGYALGMLIYGPFSNRFGRKPALYKGIAIAIIGSLLSILAIYTNLFWLLLIGRISTAIGAAAGFVIPLIMLGDLYEPREMRKRLALISLGFALGPAIGILFGGYLTEYFGWQNCFYLMGLYSLFTAILVPFLPETLPLQNRKKIHLVTISKSYLSLLGKSNILIAGALTGLAASTIYLFVAQAPFFGIATLGLRPDTFSLLSLFPYLGMLGGSLFTRFISHYLEATKLLVISSVCYIATAGAMLLLTWSGVLSPIILFLFPSLLFFISSPVFVNSHTIGMSLTKDKAHGAAVVSFINLGLPFAIITCLALEKIETIKLFSLIYFLMGFIIVLLSWTLKRILDRKAI